MNPNELIDPRLSLSCHQSFLLWEKHFDNNQMNLWGLVQTFIFFFGCNLITFTILPPFILHHHQLKVKAADFWSSFPSKRINTNSSLSEVVLMGVFYWWFTVSHPDSLPGVKDPCLTVNDLIMMVHCVWKFPGLNLKAHNASGVL